MTGYALIKDGLVINTVVWDGKEEVNFGDDVEAVDITDNPDVGKGYIYINGAFTPPPLTAEEEAEKISLAKQENIAVKNSLISEANLKISVLQDALDLEMATDQEKAELPLWKKYRVIISRIDENTADVIIWPEKPSS